MRNILKQKFEDFQSSKRGAALLMVLLITMFVIIMGSSVVFTSYNGYIIKLVDREGVNTFYTTEELTDLVRVSVQEAASSALEVSYTKVMSEFAFILAQYPDTTTAQQVAQEKFNQYFIEELSKYQVGSGSSTGATLFTLTNGVDSTTGNVDTSGVNGPVEGTFSTAVLASLLPNEVLLGTGGNLATIEGVSGSHSSNGTSYGATIDGGTGGFTFTVNETGYPRLVLEGITVNFVTDSGYETNITTDIVIEMPIFTQTGELNTGSMVNPGLPFDNAATIGKYWVKTSTRYSDGLLVDGDIYGGTFFTYTESSNIDPSDIVFSHGGGKLITNTVPIIEDGNLEVFSTGTLTLSEFVSAQNIWGDTFDSDFTDSDGHSSVAVAELWGLEVYGGTSFYSRSDSEIWTSGISVYPGSDLSLNGTTYAENDLTVAGGLYIPGSSQAFGVNCMVNLSGAYYGNGTIITRGDEVTLDLSGRIILADTVKLTPSYGGVEYDIMGQSIAAAPDQIAYLIPTAAFGGSTISNPQVSEFALDFTNPELVAQILEFELWNGKKIGDYVDNSNPVTTISRRFAGSTSGGVNLHYYFFNLVDAVKTGVYLKDYVDNNDAFLENLEIFVDMNVVADNLSASTAGSFYFVDENNDLNVSFGTSVDLSSYQADFENISVTLQSDISYRESEDYPIYNGNGAITYHENPFDYFIKHERTYDSSNRLTTVQTKLNTFFWGAVGAGAQNDNATAFDLILEFKNDDGDVVALYSYGGINLEPNGWVNMEMYPELCMIIAENGVNIGEPYEGLAFSATGIAVQAPIVSDPTGVQAAMYSTCQGPGREYYLYEFFQNIDYTTAGGDPTLGATQADAVVNWSPNDLVYYENWERH